VSEGEKGPPSQVEWCGDNAVVLAWERTVVLMGPFGESLKCVPPSLARSHGPSPTETERAD